MQEIGTLPCFGKKLEVARAVSIELLQRVSDEDMYILEELRKDCSNIEGYIHEYAPYPELKKAFILRVGNMGLVLLVKEEKCIIIDITQLVEVVGR